MTVKDLFEQYKSYITMNNKPSSVKSSCDALRLYVLPMFADKELKKINARDIELWQENIIKRGLTFDYKSKIYKIFTALLNYAVKHNYVESNVVSRVGNFKNTDAKKEMLFWTEDEFKKF